MLRLRPRLLDKPIGGLRDTGRPCVGHDRHAGAGGVRPRLGAGRRHNVERPQPVLAAYARRRQRPGPGGRRDHRGQPGRRSWHRRAVRRQGDAARPGRRGLDRRQERPQPRLPQDATVLPAGRGPARRRRLPGRGRPREDRARDRGRVDLDGRSRPGGARSRRRGGRPAGLVGRWRIARRGDRAFLDRPGCRRRRARRADVHVAGAAGERRRARARRLGGGQRGDGRPTRGRPNSGGPSPAPVG